MDKLWSDDAWNDYLYWQTQDRKTLKKINALIKDIERNGLQGIGKAEPLRYRSGWSRRIDKDRHLFGPFLLIVYILLRYSMGFRGYMGMGSAVLVA